MSERDRKDPESPAGSGAAGNDRRKPSDEGETYVYKTAGIYERKGRVPIWLILVAVGLVLWSIYYLIVYWNPPS